MRTRGSRSRRRCSPPTSGSPRPWSSSSGFVPASRCSAAAMPDQVRALLREELVATLQPDLDRTLHVDRAAGRPAVVLVVGVNGTGKTTTVGKLARMLVAQDKDVMLGAADTFRAAAADQLETWGGARRRAHDPRTGGRRPGLGRLRRGPARNRAGGRRRPDRHRRAPAHEDRPDGRARQGQARRREAVAGRRGPARDRRDDGPERSDPGHRCSPRWSTSPASC